MLEKNGDSSSTRRLRRSEPRFDEPAPVRQFELEIQLRHPYWGSFRQKISAPVFMHDEPNLDDYKRDYEQKVTELHTLAVNLMKILDPSAPEHRNVGGTDSENSRRPGPSLPRRQTPSPSSSAIRSCWTPEFCPRRNLPPRKSSCLASEPSFSRQK